MLNYNHLYYFHAVATEGSIARAAQALGVTQPTVSEQLRQLERSLGVQLFERSPAGLRLTDAGRATHEHTRVMFQAAERLVGALGAPERPTPRAFHVGVAASVARGVAVSFLMPVITLDDCVPSVRTGELVDFVRALRAGELDLVLTETEPVASAMQGLRSIELYRPRLVGVVCPAQHPPEREFVWHDVPLVHYRPGSSYRWEVDDWFEARGASPRVVAEADDGLLLLEAAAQGAGVSFVPTALARDAIRLGRVRAVATLDPSAGALRAILHDREDMALAERAVERLRAHALTAFAEPE